MEALKVCASHMGAWTVEGSIHPASNILGLKTVIYVAYNLRVKEKYQSQACGPPTHINWVCMHPILLFRCFL